VVGRRWRSAWAATARGGRRTSDRSSRLYPPAENDQGEEWPRIAPPSVVRPRRLAAAVRRLIRPLPLLGVGLIAVALVGLVSGGRPSAEREFVAATRGLPAGSVLGAGDLAPVALAAAPQLLSRLVPASREGALVGRRCPCRGRASLRPGAVRRRSRSQSERSTHWAVGCSPATA
jgi:hypothetical protein